MFLIFLGSIDKYVALYFYYVDEIWEEQSQKLQLNGTITFYLFGFFPAFSCNLMNSLYLFIFGADQVSN